MIANDGSLSKYLAILSFLCECKLKKNIYAHVCIKQKKYSSFRGKGSTTGNKRQRG